MFDVAFDSSGHVFASNTFSQECKASCTGGIYPVAWWNARSPSSPATGIQDINLTVGDYLDVDSEGNLYVAGDGCIGSACGFLVDEIQQSDDVACRQKPDPAYPSGRAGVSLRE